MSVETVAGVTPSLPKPERPQRQGVRRESVENSLAAAAAKLSNMPVSVSCQCGWNSALYLLLCIHGSNSYLHQGEDQPKCNACECPLTVKHILLDCTDFSDVGQKYFSVASTNDLFDRVDVRNIVAFIKETYFYRRL